MDITNTIIVSVAVALIYVFIIKPRKDKKAAENSQTEADITSFVKTDSIVQQPISSKAADDDCPSFTEEEISALCTIALSLVDIKIYNPKFLMVFMHENEGLDEDEVYHKMHNITRDFPKAYGICKDMTDTAKRLYAAGLFAAAIKTAEYDAGRDGWVVNGWLNCVRTLLRLSSTSIEDFESAAIRYNDRPRT